MADWTTLGTTELGVDRIATSPTMVALYENITAVMQGAAGAPRLQNAAVPTGELHGSKLQASSVGEVELEASAVTQGRINTASGTVTYGPAGSGVSHFVLPGGQYGFYPQVRTANSGDVIRAQIAGDDNDVFGGPINTSFTARLTLGILQGSGTTEARQRYILTSPPFDMGDGDVAGFVFALVRGGHVVGTYIADVPPWAYNGPTDIGAHRIDEAGRKFRLVNRRAQALMRVRRGEMSMAEARELPPGLEEEEVTQELKQRDMPLIPHPFSPLEDDTVVLLDPMDKLVADLIEGVRAGEPMADLLIEGTLRPDNEPLRRAGPPGVMQSRIIA